jgi:hypothetical protein
VQARLANKRAKVSSRDQDDASHRFIKALLYLEFHLAWEFFGILAPDGPLALSTRQGFPFSPFLSRQPRCYGIARQRDVRKTRGRSSDSATRSGEKGVARTPPVIVAVSFRGTVVFRWRFLSAAITPLLFGWTAGGFSFSPTLLNNEPRETPLRSPSPTARLLLYSISSFPRRFIAFRAGNADDALLLSFSLEMRQSR